MTISPGNYDLTIYQGATFSQTLTWKDASNMLVNLTGYTARMMARTAVSAASPFITLTTENGGITLGGTAGSVTLNMTAAATSAITEALGVYDLELVAPGGDVPPPRASFGTMKATHTARGRQQCAANDRHRAFDPQREVDPRFVWIALPACEPQ